MVSSATGFTPNEGREKKNELNVKLKLELGRKTTRKYPPIEVNDKVRIYKKKVNSIRNASPYGLKILLMLIKSRRV